MRFSDHFKQCEENLRLLLARLLVEFQGNPEKLEKYITKIKKESVENIYENVDKIFSQLSFIEGRVIFVRYGTLSDNPLTYESVSTIMGLKEADVKAYDKEALKRLKALGIKDSLERLINNSS